MQISKQCIRVFGDRESACGVSYHRTLVGAIGDGVVGVASEQLQEPPVLALSPASHGGRNHTHLSRTFSPTTTATHPRQYGKIGQHEPESKFPSACPSLAPLPGFNSPCGAYRGQR